MHKPTSRLGRTVVNLALACLNATLILVAVCLFLEWRVVKAVDGLTQSFAQNLIKVEPLRDSVEKLNEQTSGLRNDLAVWAETPKTRSNESFDGLSMRVEALNAELADLNATLGEIAKKPEALIDHGIEKGAQKLIDGLANLRGCDMPQTSEV